VGMVLWSSEAAPTSMTLALASPLSLALASPLLAGARWERR